VAIYPYNLIKTIRGKWAIEWMIGVQCQKRIVSSISTRKQDAFQWDDVDANFILYLRTHRHLDLFSANTQTQPSAGWNVAPFGHIIPTQSLPIFALK
jgi:hypothetical protein